VVDDLPGTRRSTRSRQDGAVRAEVTETPAPTTPAPTTSALTTLAPPAAGSRRALRASGALDLTRAERRALRHRGRTGPSRLAVGTRVAKGAVAVGLAFGVGGFAIASERGNRQSAEVAPQHPVLTPAAVQERQVAVELAASTAAAADDARAAAQASTVAEEQVAPLTEAIARLDSILAATQQAQPAVTQLAPVALENTAQVVVTPTTDALNPTAGLATPEVAATASPSAEATTEATTEALPTATDPAAAQLLTAAERVDTLTEQIRVVTEQADQAAAEEAARVAAEQEAQQAAALAAAAAEAERKAAQAASLDAYANGKIPSSALCGLSFASGHELRCDAAEALEALNTAYRAEFGTDLTITDSYRSYAAQVACQAAKGSLCATPGTSNHGTGTAVDFGGTLSGFGSTGHDWLLAHAPEFGWDLPSWARANGSKPEPWHWEFTA
jgi:LAS superfamily LD-carboxypeptidase LdcB